jgi:hypothetical protein
MAEPTSRIEQASSNREQPPQGTLNRGKPKRRPNVKLQAAPIGTVEPAESDDEEKHELDTMA